MYIRITYLFFIDVKFSLIHKNCVNIHSPLIILFRVLHRLKFEGGNDRCMFEHILFSLKSQHAFGVAHTGHGGRTYTFLVTQNFLQPVFLIPS